MPTITIRNLSDAAHRGLKARATQNGRSVAAETRHIIETAVFPETRLKLGSAIAEISRRHGLTDAEINALDRALAHETRRKPVDGPRLQSLTASMPLQTQTAADLVRLMRDDS